MLSRTPRTVAIRAAATAPLLGRRAFSSEAVRFDFNPDRPIECYETDGPQPNDHYMATGEEMKEYLGHMITARRMEIVNDNLYKAQKIKGFCHLYDGQEAIGMGMEAAMTKSDSLTTSYRCHAWQYFRGNGEGVSSVKSVIAELMGKAEGCSKGKGGSMHMYNPAMGFFGGNGIVGAQASTATGNALAFKYSGEKGSYNVSFGLYGDGAANQGQIFESMNMAALWKLPMVYVCENNKFGMGTSTKRSSALDEYYKRGQYMPGLKVDGMDVLSVKACTEFAIAHCRCAATPPQPNPLHPNQSIAGPLSSILLCCLAHRTFAGDLLYAAPATGPLYSRWTLTVTTVTRCPTRAPPTARATISSQSATHGTRSI